MKSFTRCGFREVYRNQWLAFEVHDVVHPSGASGEHGLVVTPPSSAAVIADGGDLLFTRQARFGAQAEMLEIVKGGARPNESALECAQRETREELGIVAERWQSLGRLYEIPSIVGAPVEIFLARGIEHVQTDFEPVESIELVRVPQEAALRAAASGQLNDAITVAALLRYGLAVGALSLRGAGEAAS